MLEKVTKRIELVSTNSRGSLGFHPLIYYYARSGNFLPAAFLATLDFAKRLDDEHKKKSFTNVRRRFEDYIFNNKAFVSLTITRLGSGARSLTRIGELYWEIFKGFNEGLNEVELYNRLIAKNDFVHLKIADIPSPTSSASRSEKGASRESKSAAFIRAAMSSPVRCSVCDGAVHKNSMTFDHVVPKRDGGDNWSENLRPVHPFCNSGVKG